MKPEVVLQALLAIWDELPDLVGPDWPGVLARLEALAQRLADTGDPEAATEIVLVMRPFPAARERLRVAADAVPEPVPDRPRPFQRDMAARPVTRSAGGLRGALRRVGGGTGEGHLREDVVAPVAAGPDLRVLAERLGGRVAEAQQAFRAGARPPVEPPVEPPEELARDQGPEPPAEPPAVTCHVRAEMDQRMTVGRVTTVEVIASREAIGRALGEAAAEGAAAVDPGRRLIIQVLPKANVEAVGDSRVEIDVPATGEPQTVYFDLRPTDPGTASVWVIVRQGQVPLITLKLAARVTKTASAARAGSRASADGRSADSVPLAEPLHQLRISERQRGGSLYYEYELEAPELGLLEVFESRPIIASREQYVGSLFKRIEDRWLSTNADVQEFLQELREFGGELLDELIPDDLQRILWENRRRLTSIQVLATEPFIPWELVHLRPPGRPLPRETRFLGQMGLVRWLYDGGWPPDRLQARAGRARYLIPDYPDERYALPEAAAERQFLEQAFGATAVEPQPNPVRALLSARAGFDLLHFAGHGAAESGAINEARLLLEGRIEDGRYVEASLTTTTVSNRCDLRPSRPIVVLNACQVGRLGYGLTGLGGFAQAFLECGAGAFVGTQWSVGDAPARVFTETFYSRLLAGVTVAEATVAARERARADGDATWLAYAVYAHPHARLVR